jgi:hypothetical protein
MLFSNGSKLNMRWVTPTFVITVIVISVISKFLVPLSVERFVVLLLNLTGTVLLATAFEAHIPLHGNGGWWDSLKFPIKEFPKYGSPPAFNFVHFYAGLVLLLVGTLLSAVWS